MAQPYTRKLIRDTFVAMLNERALDKITVKDLVERCEINRNTFYYYYQDLYAILDEVFQKELQKVLDEYSDRRAWEESFLIAARFALSNRRAVYHVFNSMRKDELVKYVFEVAGSVMHRYVATQNEGIGAPRADVARIAAFYQSALVGMVTYWLESGMKQDPEAVIRRIGLLFDGNIALSLRRAAAQPDAADGWS